MFRAVFEDGAWGLRWPTTASLTAVGRQLGPLRAGPGPERAMDPWIANQWKQVLPHELGHALLASSLGLPDGPAGAGVYGTPLPDWFDEAVAIWMEPGDAREARLARVMAAEGGPPSLVELLGRRHPAADSAFRGWRTTMTIRNSVGPCRGVCTPVDTRPMRITSSVDTSGRGTVDTTYLTPESDSVRPPSSADAFYAPALAALTFVHERGGTAATRELRTRLRTGHAEEMPLTGLPGLPADSAALQSAWEAWWRSTSRKLARRP